MDTACLDYCLTDEERNAFEQDGFLIVEDALDPEMIDALTTVVERLDAEHRAENEVGAHDRMHLRDFVGKDEIFLELLDWPKTFPKVWGILGWHIQLYLSHLDVTPPLAPDAERKKKRLGWHQDSGRLNQDIETTPRPRISVKVAYFLSDTTEAGRGNFSVIPGSHLQNELVLPDDETQNPENAMPVCVTPGTAVLFDRRLWHSASPNESDMTRKVLFYGYSYRWLRPRDDMTVAHFMEQCEPIRCQLLGAGAGGSSYTSPSDEDVPLKIWIKEHLGAEAVVS
jgi:ectoine hydroxylase-related dioxygenase (phytanoyl-CoA dioxygenase family)